MKRSTPPSCFLLLILLCMSVAASVWLFDIGVGCLKVLLSSLMLISRLNWTVAYVVFNFISIVIFLGFLKSLKPITNGDIDEMFFVPHSQELFDHEIILVEEENKEGGDSDDDEDDEYNGYDGYDGSEEDDDDDTEAEENEDSEAEEGDGDLERRSEEFIAKMNGRWREELLHERLLCMVYASAPKLELL